MKTLHVIVLMVCVTISNAQNTADTSFMPTKLKRISTPKAVINPNDERTVLLSMEFNGAIPTEKLHSINTNNIVSISLVYTRYKFNELFNQMNLNAERMLKLHALAPALNTNKNIQWYWVEQTGCDSPEGCNDYFHGFIITLKSEKEELKRETEIDLLSYYMNMLEGKTDDKKMDSIITARKLNLVKVCDTIVTRTKNSKNKMAMIGGWSTKNRTKLARYLHRELRNTGIYNLQLILNQYGKLSLVDEENQPNKATEIVQLLNDKLPKTPAKYNKKRISSKLVITIDATSSDVTIGIFQQPILPNGLLFNLDSFLYTTTKTVHCEYIDTAIERINKINYRKYTKDASELILTVFDRNSQWENCLIATDVTGSMYPYLAQFQLWHKLNLVANSGNHDFVFFNDGNLTPDHAKVIPI